MACDHGAPDGTIGRRGVILLAHHDRAPVARFAASPGAVALVVALASLLFFAGIGAYPLVDGDAAFYGRVARNAAERGDWLPMRFSLNAGGYQVDKPPLGIWLMAASFALFGPSEAAARAQHAALAVLLVMVTTVFARRRLGPLPGLLAGLVLTTAAQVFYLAREPMLDVPLALSVVLTIDLADRFAASRCAGFFYLACAVAGAGVLCKGPLALVLPVVVLVADGVWSGGGVGHYLPNGWKQRTIGCLVLLAIVVPWHLAVFVKEGWAYADMYVGTISWRRWANPESLPGLGLVAYPALLAVGLLPWTGAAVAALVDACSSRTRSDSVRLASLWVLATIALFAISPGRIVLRYLLPAFPGAALLVANRLTDPAVRYERTPGVLTILAGLVLAGWAVTAGLGLKAAGAAPEIIVLAARRFALLLAVVMIAGGAAWVARRRVAGVIVLALGASAGYLMLVASAPAIVTQLYPERAIAAAVNGRSAVATRVAIFRAEPAEITMLAFYLNPPFEDCVTAEQIERFVSRPGDRWVIELPGRPLPSLLRTELHVMATYPGGVIAWRKR